ncbi:HNH endonuclease signature motif containing protein [Microbacterium sp. NIBRBAC000506063]|uniref:HNH endonuclease signature motif containing protein n=1 Tax=Microbacterium sp. NIBRBAC000506063 TaxID=2734618 RepID=UPI001CB73CD5|nr:HNH endonuclease signature motif containing protein [Microbacterium sp. NIBRBAC000506063]
MRVGEALLADAAPQADALAGEAATAAPPSTPWHAPLGRAVLEGALTSAQHDAIRRGLGEPPEQPGDGEQGADAADVRDGGPDRDSENAAVREMWTLAAEQLLTEAPHRTVEELRAAAKAVRDRLDPKGAEERFRKQLARRSFRVWTDREGVHHGHFVFDDEAMLWVRTLIDSALRPRRGGPRFVDSAEAARAQDLVDDPRTNDQLTYDLMIDVLRAGTLAESENVFGTRQAGVRIVRVVDTDEDGNDQPAPTAHSEDGIISLPGAVAERHICNSGTTTVTVDAFGNPLDVGREQRLFTPRQRIALAIRDGGCRWKGCDRPASYCEAHHIDPYSEGGRTDIDRGILLCRFHHMQLHHGGWRITRDGKGDFILQHPDGSGTVLHPQLALGYAWAGIDPPPRRFRPAAA